MQLKGGILNEVLFTLRWENGDQCVNDLIIDYCRKNGIQYRYSPTFQSEIFINGEWIKTDYICKKNRRQNRYG